MYFETAMQCAEPEVENPIVIGNETAWAFSDITFQQAGIGQRWGWIVEANGSMSTPIYAGAGQNNIANGVHVGTLTIAPGSSSTTVTYTMLPGYVMSETHLYVGTTMPTTTAPGAGPEPAQPELRHHGDLHRLRHGLTALHRGSRGRIFQPVSLVPPGLHTQARQLAGLSIRIN